jgi:hypothetical protein
MHRHRIHHQYKKENSRVKIVHNVAKGPKVNVFVDGNEVISDVDYRVQSEYLKLPSGKHSLSIETGGKVLASANVDLAPRGDYTVIAHGDVNNLSSISLLALRDNNSCPASGKAHIRFVHAAAGAPSVDIWAENVARIFENISYGETGTPSYFPVDAGIVEVSVTPTKTVQRVLGPISLNLEQGKVYTVIASGIVGDNVTPLTVLVHEDTKCSVNMHMIHHGIKKSSDSKMMPLWLNL